MTDCDFEYDGPRSVLCGGSYDGETVSSAACCILVPKRPHRGNANVYEKYVRRTDADAYDFAGTE